MVTSGLAVRRSIRQASTPSRASRSRRRLRRPGRASGSTRSHRARPTPQCSTVSLAALSARPALWRVFRSNVSASLTRSPTRSSSSLRADPPSPPVRCSRSTAEVGDVTKESRMSNPVVLITGGLSGIGRAAAIAFAKKGAKVVVAGRRDEAGQALVNELRLFGAEAEFINADVRKEDDVRALVDQTVARFGRLDVAVNNAGTE